MSVNRLIFRAIVCFAPLFISACSLNSMPDRLSTFFIEQRIDALNRENDLERARHILPENIHLLEDMISTDRKNPRLHTYAAQAYYGYGFAFVEDAHPRQAISLYYKALAHGRQALAEYGITRELLNGNTRKLKLRVAQLPREAVAALYWTALSWARLIEIRQPDLISISQLHKAVILMERVLKLDAAYQQGGPYLFFAVYYSRPSLLGGNRQLAEQYFERARRVSNNRLLLVDYLQARYLNGSVSGSKDLNHRLQRIIQAPENLYPEYALMNAVARQKAARLLSVDYSVAAYPGKYFIPTGVVLLRAALVNIC